MAARRTGEHPSQQGGNIATHRRCRFVCHAAGNGERKSLWSLMRLLIKRLTLSWTRVGSGKPNRPD